MLRLDLLFFPLILGACAAAGRPPPSSSRATPASSAVEAPVSTAGNGSKSSPLTEPWLILDLPLFTVHVPPSLERKFSLVQGEPVTSYGAGSPTSDAWFQILSFSQAAPSDGVPVLLGAVAKTICPAAHVGPLLVERHGATDVTKASVTCASGKTRVEVYRAGKDFCIVSAPDSPSAKMEVDRFFDSIRLSDKPVPLRIGGAWQTFTSPGNAFEIALPGPPTTEVKTIEDGRKIELFIAAIGNEGARFGVFAISAPDGSTKSTALDLASSVAARPECSGTVFELVKHHPTAASRYQIFCMNGSTFLADVHVREKAYYAVVAFLPPDADVVHAVDWEQFRDSFRTVE